MVYRWRHRSESQTTIRQFLPAVSSGSFFRHSSGILPADRLNIFIQQSQQSQPAKPAKPAKPTSKAAKQSQQSQQAKPANPAKPHNIANKQSQLSHSTKPTS